MSDGTRIKVFANLGSLAEAELAEASGAEGCGLLRTEFLFLDRETPPDEDEQAGRYEAIARALGGRPLIIRLLDVGGDKTAPYLPIAAEENPALGVRGVRLLMRRPQVLKAQLRAILRGAPHAKIMAPMVASLSELRAVRAALDEARQALGRAGRTDLGVMIETPAAAATARSPGRGSRLPFHRHQRSQPVRPGHGSPEPRTGRGDRRPASGGSETDRSNRGGRTQARALDGRLRRPGRRSGRGPHPDRYGRHRALNALGGDPRG
jgi:hypothetical protein